MSHQLNRLLVDKSATATGKGQACDNAKRYTVDVHIEGTVTALTISINGGLSNDGLNNMVTRDIIAEGQLFFLNGMGVDFMSADIDTYAGSGTVTVLVKAIQD